MKLTMLDIEKMKTIGELREYPEDTYIFKQGTLGIEMYVIISGEIELYMGNCNNYLSLGKLTSGDVIGEMSLLETMPRCATAKTTTECMLFIINRRNFKKIFELLPTIAMRITKNLSCRLRQQNEELWILKNNT
ncbi:cyclic nucleotide-binding domain-containing protein [Clostridium aestuarii]|uniref:Cyclic nucleotide-binding domain-containing protein n=1 Tax=Clostridium aestuarii TaxID=338193 RepID=A0ABT4D5N1_9CLOT|nr:cyclic nucleotide-binding domain-containing protein [Clostridium aestuarii]MCY6485495.1 cyclic nucleotide-binding domain-containing protein [Clostridium aestuarii]